MSYKKTIGSDNNSQHLMGENSNTYANIFSFMGFPLSRELTEEIDLAIMGVPYDLATSARPGTRYGPNAIRQASSILRWEKQRWPHPINLQDELKVLDYGDLDFEIGKHDKMLENVISHADQIFSGNKKLLTFGGDHYVTLPLLRSAAKHHGKLALIHFDAHTDNETGFDGHYHGSMFYHAPIEGLIDTEKSIQIGIRTEYDLKNHPFQVLNADWANDHSADEIIQQIKLRVGNMPAYLSFDIDCLDPAFAPATGTPVVGGLSSNKALQIIRGLKDLNIVAMDLMEVSPAYDQSEITALAAATLALEMLYMIAATKV